MTATPNDSWLLAVYGMGLLVPGASALAARRPRAVRVVVGLTLLVTLGLVGLSYWSLQQPGADGQEGLIGVYGVLLTLSLLLGFALRGVRRLIRKRAV